MGFQVSYGFIKDSRKSCLIWLLFPGGILFWVQKQFPLTNMNSISLYGFLPQTTHNIECCRCVLFHLLRGSLIFSKIVSFGESSYKFLISINSFLHSHPHYISNLPVIMLSESLENNIRLDWVFKIQPKNPYSISINCYCWCTGFHVLNFKYSIHLVYPFFPLGTALI